MMLLGIDERGRWLRVALATVHISIKSVPEKLTAEKITLAIELAAQVLPRPRFAARKNRRCRLESPRGRRRTNSATRKLKSLHRQLPRKKTRIRCGRPVERRHRFSLRAARRF
jgi:hypothetical protein